MWGNHDETESGGGFMDESYNVNTTSTTTKESQQTTVRSSNILPIMIGNLLQHTPDSLTYRDIKVRVVRVVAVVKKITRATTKIAYELEDETGKICAYRWLEADNNETDESVNVEVNKYAEIHGCLREGGEEAKHIFILKIRPITKFSVVLTHLLEVTSIAVHSNNEKINLPPRMDYDTTADSGMDPDQEAIFKLIKEMDAYDVGIERNELKAKVAPNLLSKVDKILEFLVSEGHIYTTRTDDHFKAT